MSGNFIAAIATYISYNSHQIIKSTKYESHLLTAVDSKFYCLFG